MNIKDLFEESFSYFVNDLLNLLLTEELSDMEIDSYKHMLDQLSGLFDIYKEDKELTKDVIKEEIKKLNKITTEYN